MEESITRLEMKTAFMEDTLLTLNTLVVEQQKQIDALTTAVQKLEARLGYLIEMEGETAKADQRPPHY
ncbi:MAG: SlyX family protein [Sphaerochaetaceae bacterium]|nr:SlyX family protein [Sphaerochaetaceae bacterium]